MTHLVRMLIALFLLTVTSGSFIAEAQAPCAGGVSPRFLLGGQVTNPKTYDLQELQKLPRTQVHDFFFTIVYCTSARLRLSQLPTLQVVDIPEALRVGPEYGLALLKEAQPGAVGLMLYILSVDGQATLEKFGFRPVGLPSKAKE